MEIPKDAIDLSHELAIPNDAVDLSHELPGNKKESWMDNEVPLVGGTPRGYIKGALNSLPTVGVIGGGLLGTAAEPGGGTVGGAALGAAGGESLKNLGEKYILGEDKSRADIYGGPAKAALEGATAEAGGQVLGKAGSAIAESPIGQKVGGLMSKGASRVGEMFTGVPQKEIETYAKNPEAIKSLSKSSDNSTFEAANQIRSGFSNDINQTRQGLNSEISDALKGNETRVRAKPILDELNNVKATIDPELYPEQVKQVDEIIDRISTKITPAGRMSIQDANSVKGFLQKKASSAYKSNGDIFNVGTEAAKAAKGGGAVTRGLVNEGSPAVAGANSKLADLHDIEDSLNPNLIGADKPESALIAAGSGGNPRNAEMLGRLGEATGTDMQGEAEKLAAMRTFGKPSFNPASMTGKSLLHAGKGAAVGGLMGYEAGGKEGAAIGAFAGGMLTSPASLKMAIDSGLLTKQALGSPKTQAMIGKGLLNKAKSWIDQHSQLDPEQRQDLEQMTREKLKKEDDLKRTSGGN